MKQSLQLRLGQQLTMTPQLQQAIRLLQLSTLDLQAEIQDALENNSMLELQEDSQDTPADATPEAEAHTPTAAVSGAETTETVAHEEQTTTPPAEENIKLENEEIPNDLPVDSMWEDVYSSGPVSRSGDSDETFSYDARNCTQPSLQDHLTWQMQLTPFTDVDRTIAEAIIDSIDEQGFLRCDTADILDTMHQDKNAKTEEETITLDEVEAVLHRLQNFDPAGVAARDLGECLVIQLKQLPSQTLHRDNAIKAVTECMQLLAEHDYKRLGKQLKLNDAELAECVKLIRSMNPRPGNAVTANVPQYIVPDVLVRKHEQRWIVELNHEAIPRLRINSSYASLVQRADNSTDNHFMRNHLQEARWFIKSLQSRNETLLKVTKCIVEHQQGFLEHGEEAMKPLVLHDIADALNMHESTISRVTTQKYMFTPRGIFELKYFFSSHVNTTDGGECSSIAIRALLKKLISAEDSTRPLSDSKLAELLQSRGIQVARRTIAKYREAMAIPSSNERKRLKCQIHQP